MNEQGNKLMASFIEYSSRRRRRKLAARFERVKMTYKTFRGIDNGQLTLHGLVRKRGIEIRRATSASTTRGGRREDSVPDERAKPKRRFIRFLPPPADIKLNLFQFVLNRVTIETLPSATSRHGRSRISQLVDFETSKN